MFSTSCAAGTDGFYMFDQMTAEADAKWADAAHSVPASIYWLSDEAPAEERWDLFDPARHMLRPAPGAPTTIDPAYVGEMVQVFSRAGFHAPLNYYRRDRRVLRNRQPGLGRLRHRTAELLPHRQRGWPYAVRSPTEHSLRQTLPELRGFLALDGVGHWPQLEAPEAFNATLLRFLGSVS